VLGCSKEGMKGMHLARNETRFKKQQQNHRYTLVKICRGQRKQSKKKRKKERKGIFSLVVGKYTPPWKK
jgi:hypothetical protein